MQSNITIENYKQQTKYKRAGKGITIKELKGSTKQAISSMENDIRLVTFKHLFLNREVYELSDSDIVQILFLKYQQRGSING